MLESGLKAIETAPDDNRPLRQPACFVSGLLSRCIRKWNLSRVSCFTSAVDGADFSGHAPIDANQSWLLAAVAS